MTAGRQLQLARRTGAVSALVTVVAVAWLLVDHGLAARRAPAEQARVKQLEEQVATNAAIASQLHEERKQQTARSLARDGRARALAWLLVLSCGLLVGSGKWHQSLRPQPLPSLDELVTVRFPAARPRRSEGRAALTEAVPEPGEELSFVDGLIERIGRGREAAIPILQAIQERYRYLPDAALRRVCERSEITPAQLAGTSSFYAQFRRSPVGRHVVRLCHGTACHVAGAEQIRDELRRHLGIPPGEDTDARRLVTLDAVACLGCCSLAPVVMVGDETAGRLSPASARQAVDAMVGRT